MDMYINNDDACVLECLSAGVHECSTLNLNIPDLLPKMTPHNSR